ncbi:MAG: response regulator [Pyrinomonadaceae bacterium]
MKLEFETNTSTFPSVESDFLNDAEAGKISAEVLEMLNDGIKAAQEGRRAEARNLLLRVTEMDSGNENAWLWLASISEYPEELLVFLNSVLKINPENERALEWAKATKTLLSKTFVQRGIDASKEIQKDFAKQCFLQAIVHDNQNEMAWLWLASVSDSDEEKTSYLQKVLSINPENVTAQASLKSIKKQMAEGVLQKAFAAAVEGENEQALKILRDASTQMAEMEDAWILKSFLIASCAEKVKCFGKVLEINPGNNLAQANMEFLRAMQAKTETQKTVEEVSETKEFAMESAEDEFKSNFDDQNKPAAEAAESEEEFFAGEDENRIPTQELEFPQYAAEEDDFEAEPQAEFEEVEFQAEEIVEEDFNPQTEFSAEYETEEELEIPESAFQTKEAKENFDNAEVEAESEVVNLDEVQQFPQVYAYQEAGENPAGEDVSYAIHETEPVGFYSDFGEESFDDEEPEVVTPEENSSNEYKFEDDEPELLENDFAPEQESAEQVSVEDNSQDFEEFELQPEEEFSAEPEMQQQNAVEADFQTQAEMSACMFCEAENEAQAFVCRNCKAVMTLSDLEMLLAPVDTDNEMIGDAMRRMEMVKTERDLEAGELKHLGIGYFNLKNPKKGILYLNEAARLNPDDIVLSSKVNALKIRMSEIEKQKSVQASKPKNMTILVVDDSATVRKLISGKLEKSGHEVVCAIDGVDAIEKLNEIVPDLILLDITMPRMDGYQVCKLIRANESMKDVPIVMISGKDGFFDKVRGRMAGTTGYITKPFGPETLMKTVETYVGGQPE